MNNCRAGLYGFAATTTWLREIGTASPPFLVMLGLTLPDSRILNGIAGIGLTLVNIAIILPHLRQPMLDSIHASETALTHQQNAPEQSELSSDESNTMQPVDLKVDSSALALASLCDREHPGGSETIKFVCPALTEPLERLAVSSKVATLLPADDDQISPRIHCSPNVDKVTSPNNTLMRQGQSALRIPLPVPGAEEVAFFNTNLGEASDACEQHTGPEEDSAPEDDVQIAAKVGIHHLPMLIVEKAIEQGDHLVADESIAHPAAKLPVLEVPAKRRPESLNFIPQSVVRRYPSAPMISSGRCVGHRTFSSGHDHQFTLTPPYTLVHNSAVLPSGTTPQASYIASEEHWRGTFVAEVEPNTRSMGGQPLIITAHDSLMQRLISPPDLPAVHQLMPFKKYPTHQRQLGILARAALRNRKSAARRRRNNGTDGFSTSDSDSDCDSDSQYSSGSSADERMLPHMLGADLIAAIDANSESELNLAGSRRTNYIPLDMYEDFLVSDDSAADVSMIMHVSSHDDAADGDVKAPVTLRSLTYEDIQQWASGVVQKCVRQVCRSRAPVTPLSPSQASDVCAERPSGSGISQCPLSGLHCKLGVAALAQVPAPKTNELPTPTLPTRKPSLVRNVRDIPEFVPRQRHVSVVTRPGTSTRDAASEVIARMESQAGFNTRQWLADEIRRVSTVRGCQGAPMRV